VAVNEARALGGFDFVALTLTSVDGGKRRHKVAKVAGADGAKVIQGFEFADNTGLVSNVIRYRAPLPKRDARDMDQMVIFDAETRLKGLNTLKILPLQAGGGVVGTLCLGAKRRGALHEDLVRTLEMLADQIGQSLLRAQLYDQMERMATTDGLTGLLNHRTMQAKLDELVGLANRYEKKLTILLTDIDHFKSVNDTYGHPVGDVVLKGVAKVLRRTARDTDIVARYGGEEFCVIMPETDAGGAKVMAERIRKEVEATTFETEQGPLKVTLSLGISTFPDVGRQKQQIIDRADQCLYFAKRNGRNRSVTVAEMTRAA
jgi:diguanylate cyclase (GGDEF)-like protein